MSLVWWLLIVLWSCWADTSIELPVRAESGQVSCIQIRTSDDESCGPSTIEYRCSQAANWTDLSHEYGTCHSGTLCQWCGHFCEERTMMMMTVTQSCQGSAPVVKTFQQFMYSLAGCPTPAMSIWHTDQNQTTHVNLTWTEQDIKSRSHRYQWILSSKQGAGGGIDYLRAPSLFQVSTLRFSKKRAKHALKY